MSKNNFTLTLKFSAHLDFRIYSAEKLFWYLIKANFSYAIEWFQTALKASVVCNVKLCSYSSGPGLSEY